MPFRPVNLHVEYGKPQPLVAAEDGDVELLISCTTYGATGVSGGPNYLVGVKAGDTVAGIYVTDNSFSCDLEPGDELWVAAAEELPFASAIHITGLIRSAAKKDESGSEDRGERQGDGQGEVRGRRDPAGKPRRGESAEKPQESQDEPGDDADPAE